MVQPTATSGIISGGRGTIAPVVISGGEGFPDFHDAGASGRPSAVGQIRPFHCPGVPSALCARTYSVNPAFVRKNTAKN